MSIWYILLVTVSVVDGDVKVFAETRYPNTPEYNNEKTCDEVGKYLMEQEQIRIGTDGGIVYYDCKVISSEEQRKATTKQDQGQGL